MAADSDFMAFSPIASDSDSSDNDGSYDRYQPLEVEEDGSDEEIKNPGPYIPSFEGSDVEDEEEDKNPPPPFLNIPFPAMQRLVTLMEEMYTSDSLHVSLSVTSKNSWDNIIPQRKYRQALNMIEFSLPVKFQDGNRQRRLNEALRLANFNIRKIEVDPSTGTLRCSMVPIAVSPISSIFFRNISGEQWATMLHIMKHVEAKHVVVTKTYKDIVLRDFLHILFPAIECFKSIGAVFTKAIQNEEGSLRKKVKRIFPFHLQSFDIYRETVIVWIDVRTRSRKTKEPIGIFLPDVSTPPVALPRTTCSGDGHPFPVIDM